MAQRLRFEGTTSAAGPSRRGGRDGPMWPSNRKNWPTSISARNHDLIDLLSRLNAHLSSCPALARPYSAACRNVAVNGTCLAKRIPPALSSLAVSSAPTSTRQRISHSECPPGIGLQAVRSGQGAILSAGRHLTGADAIGRSDQARAQCRQKRQGISRRHVPRVSFCPSSRSCC